MNPKRLALTIAAVFGAMLVTDILNDGPYFRSGMYRNDTDKTYVVYFNQVKSGSNPEEIGLNPRISFS
jgi:hypothetical protein